MRRTRASGVNDVAGVHINHLDEGEPQRGPLVRDRPGLGRHSGWAEITSVRPALGVASAELRGN
jgi:hypothetical protein